MEASRAPDRAAAAAQGEGLDSSSTASAPELTMTEHTGPTAEQLADAIVGKREGLHFETKRVSNRAVSKALETVSAFANTEGGILALGVEDFDKAQGHDRLYGIEENP